MPDRNLQPLLHDLVSTVRAPASVLCEPSGQIRAVGVQGMFHADVRVLSRAELLLDGQPVEPVATSPLGPGATAFVGLARWLGDDGPDPTVRVTRERRLVPHGLDETITVASTAAAPISTELSLALGADLAPISPVKGGYAVDNRATREGLRWSAGNVSVTVTADGAATADDGTLRWSVTVPPRAAVAVSWQLRVADPAALVREPATPVEWSRPTVTADDRRIERLAARSLDDLESLRLRLSAGAGETFLGAGVPWYLTLFGRDSLWAARMLLPLGTDIAEGTLRVLAAHQGAALDRDTGEAPGKILHELRRADTKASLPAAYFGSVDSTLLWISLLHDAWRWGMSPAAVESLLPALEAGLAWLAEHGDADGDGFLEYIDETGRGLANQGWKDSGDSIRFRTGQIATAPIALVEVQGYAYEAALHGAALLDAFDRPGGQRWRDYADAMAARFRDTFWVDGPAGAHPALALDGDKRPVDALTSNVGHLLGTGLLTAKESAQVADLLASEAMAGGFGLRTMSTHDAAFSPLSYHCGSVWAHDTAIVVDRLARAGHPAAAATLASGLLAAAESFDYQLPELFGGDDRAALGRPVPYPAACRPQAWAAAAGITLLHAAVGLRPDVPAGTVSVTPLKDAPLGAVSVRGLRIGEASVDVAVAADGTATVDGLPTPLRLG
ncbi:glycogen debranching N-terminal domain-containing protein [Asanoa sp. WMMD1127]|uniref:amylo-alpha-1,6-glucosidase n=1 Tax=Asanoa sp. WMMD1127 TaxID=3016107 RepID=UPI0024163CB0|nr:glycogen debranching N-terminal domain-containing protein [Asanoa sp. WMMD1127]MDG4823659.1 glycogen debranching N-terminal domain-containing protein [Asanoa sp. WMMD1127]